MKFALVPWQDSELKDAIFYQQSESGERIPACNVVSEMRLVFEREGHEVHTYDLYEKWEEIDYFLLFSMDWIAAERIQKAGYGNRLIYCNAEPPSVCELHTKTGYEILRQIFPCILTWNPDWTDSKQIFKRCIPYYFSFHSCCVPFENRKLATGISANKHSTYQDELYTDRENAYRFFEKNFPDQFKFYGTQWSGKGHPCYGGTVKNKYEVFHQYRFALCYENTRTRKDYITEKIWDCLTAQIVPVYAGAENISDYIPKECYIDRFQFNSYEEMAEYLMSIDENTYKRYLEAAIKLLQSEKIKEFSSEKYVRQILYAAENMYNGFEITEYGLNFLRKKAQKERINLEYMKLRADLRSRMENLRKVF